MPESHWLHFCHAVMKHAILCHWCYQFAPPHQHTPAQKLHQKSSSDQHQLEVKHRQIIQFF